MSTSSSLPGAHQADAHVSTGAHKAIKFTKTGRVTIPKRIREALSIRQGQKGALIELSGALLILPRLPRTPALFDEVRDGLGTSDMSLEGMVSEMRRIRESGDYESNRGGEA